MTKTIESLYSILKKELGTTLATEAVSDIMYNILADLEYNKMEVSSTNIQQRLERKLADYKEATQKNDVA